MCLISSKSRKTVMEEGSLVFTSSVSVFRLVDCSGVNTERDTPYCSLEIGTTPILCYVILCCFLSLVHVWVDNKKNKYKPSCVLRIQLIAGAIRTNVREHRNDQNTTNYLFDFNWKMANFINFRCYPAMFSIASTRARKHLILHYRKQTGLH